MTLRQFIVERIAVIKFGVDDRGAIVQAVDESR